MSDITSDSLRFASFKDLIRVITHELLLAHKEVQFHIKTFRCGSFNNGKRG